jgi:hypothetical protein
LARQKLHAASSGSNSVSETELNVMQSKQFDRLFGRFHLQGDAHFRMGMLELHDELREQIYAGKRRRHDRHRTRATAAELGYAEACPDQQGLGPAIGGAYDRV